jgi:hypothetical protein
VAAGVAAAGVATGASTAGAAAGVAGAASAAFVSALASAGLASAGAASAFGASTTGSAAFVSPEGAVSMSLPFLAKLENDSSSISSSPSSLSYTIFLLCSLLCLWIFI